MLNVARSQMAGFDVSAQVLEMGVRVVVFRMSGLRNREGDAEFEALKAAS